MSEKDRTNKQLSEQEEFERRVAKALANPELAEKNRRLAKLAIRWSLVSAIVGAALVVVAMFVIPWGTTIEVSGRASRTLNMPIFSAFLFPLLFAGFWLQSRRAQRKIAAGEMPPDTSSEGVLLFGKILGFLLWAFFFGGELYWLSGFYRAAFAGAG
ncbi:hypothetical protein [Mycetocola sp. JXN-3]|uniref:hypothetical protein n=1 Tax=Mycetocola sp. JXN-3 TaxID=2116510 RepID=UPI001CAA82AB|nr:hypothetical protein [Mycetocola sp. JXN-3]